MADKAKPAAADAQLVFRQFAWNLAGTLGGRKAKPASAARPRRATGARKRSAAK